MEGRYDELHLIEDIYSVTDEWEACELRMPPFAMFSDCGLDEEDVAQLLWELRQIGYEFEVTQYPECLMDVRDMVQGRGVQRLKPRTNNDAFNYQPFVPSNRSLWKRLWKVLTRK